METKNTLHSKGLKITIIIIAVLAIAFAVFQAGVFVGFHKASFLFKSGDNFYGAFGNRNDRLTNGMGMGGQMFKDEFSGGHGAIGKIVKINLPNIVVIGPDNIEKSILVDENTNVHIQRTVASTENLTIDQYISVLGTPNDQGQIMAKFIRIMPNNTNVSGKMMQRYNTNTQQINSSSTKRTNSTSTINLN